MLNEAVSNHMDEVLARVEADRALKALARLVKVCGEAVDLDDLDFSCPPSDKEWAVSASRRFEYGTQDYTVGKKLPSQLKFASSVPRTAQTAESA
jgi:hypothetical protein